MSTVTARHTDANWLAAYAIGLAYSSHSLVEAVRRIQELPGMDQQVLDDARTRLSHNLGADQDKVVMAGTALAIAAGSLAALG